MTGAEVGGPTGPATGQATGTRDGADRGAPNGVGSQLFPVGQQGGLFVPAEQGEPAHHVVRVGHRQEHLTEGEFAIWTLAHRPARAGAPPSADTASADTANAGMASVGTVGGGPDAARRIDGMLRRGLLVEVTDPVAFAQRYRLGSLFLGLGGRPGQPGRYGIGVPGLEPMATVDTVAFELWQWGWATPSLWAHCQILATIHQQQPDQQPDQQGAAQDQVELILCAVRELLAGSVAFLEPVTTPPPAHPRSATSAAG